VHEGLLQVKGRAPHGLVWRNADGAALESRFEARNEILEYILETEGGDPRGSFMDEDATIHSLDDVPDEANSAWWRKFGHNFEFRGRHAILKSVR
jgi:hypothetical protein